MKGTGDIALGFAIAGAGIFSIFLGFYLIYEKVFLAIKDGVSDERAGTVVRTAEPWSFWLGVSVYLVGAIVVTLGGIATLIWLFRVAMEDR